MTLEARHLGQMFDTQSNQIVSAAEVVAEHTRMRRLLARCMKLIDPRSKVVAEIEEIIAGTGE